MARKRVARLNEQLKRELTALIQFEVRDPRIGMTTITDVEVSPDLYHAKVYFTLLGDEEERLRAAEGLRAASGFLRTEIGRRMHIRRAPELHFTFDNTLDHAMHIERLLRVARESTDMDFIEQDEVPDDGDADDTSPGDADDTSRGDADDTSRGDADDTSRGDAS
jgi:ribosome-binding factor A